MNPKGTPENLIQYKKGQSGNPKGRPKKEYCLTDILKKQGNIRDVDTGEKKISRKDAIAQKLWAMAMEGDVNALKYLYDRIDGKPLQQQQLTGNLKHEILEPVTLEDLKTQILDGTTREEE